MLEGLFSESDYRFRMKFERGAIPDFYQNTSTHELLIEERRKWLSEDAGKYLALEERGVPLLNRAIEIAFPGCLTAQENSSLPRDRCRLISERMEPDFLLLGPNSESGQLELCGGSVCFPSSWSLEEKMGHPMDHIHGPVPGLNEAIGKQIDLFLRTIKPGVSWNRTNWGLSRSPELNQHPSRSLPVLEESAQVGEIYFRVEAQSLVSLPPTGVLFGIRVTVYPFAQILAHENLRRGLSQALSTMPEPVVHYKNLSRSRSTILKILNGSAT